jgi:hypothetical protein
MDRESFRSSDPHILLIKKKKSQLIRSVSSPLESNRKAETFIQTAQQFVELESEEVDATSFLDC